MDIGFVENYNTPGSTAISVTLTGKEVATAISDYMKNNGCEVTSGIVDVYAGDMLCTNQTDAGIVEIHPGAKVSLSQHVQDQLYKKEIPPPDHSVMVNKSVEDWLLGKK